MNQLLTMTAAEYYADPCETPSLSQSIANTLLSRSPLHAWLQHPKLGNKPKESTKAMDRGTIIHGLLLEGKAAGIEVHDFKDWRTKDSQAAKAASEEAGRIAVLKKDFAVYEAAAEAIRKQLDAVGIKFVGESEKVALWAETADDGTPVQCRGLFDHWILGSIIDLKTTENAHPDKVRNSYITNGYDIQAAAYRSAAKAIFPDLAAIHFVNIFAEMEDPWPVTFIVPDNDMLALGKSRWRRAVNLWAKCLKSNDWPCYATEPIALSPPKWAVDREFDLRLESQTYEPEGVAS